MEEIIKIMRAETIRVEQKWRQSAGGRVFSFDMMLEMPHSPKIAALGSSPEIIFEGKRYAVDHKEIIRKTSPEMVRLGLNRTGGVSASRQTRSRRHHSPASFSGTGYASPYSPRGAVTADF